MTQSNKKGGFAALYDVAERKKAEAEQAKTVEVSSEKPALIADYSSSERPTPSPSPTIPNHPQPSPMVSPAPVRDFNKRANSIEREALPQGLFPGSSKKLWDAVYFRTRGAIQPTMEIQATKRDLMAWSGIRNIKTIEAHIRYFLTAGLMTRHGENGAASGYSYGVLMLEEIPSPSPPIPNQDSIAPSHPIPNRKTVVGGDQKTVMVGEGKHAENKGSYGESKTLFKTNAENDDDAALAGLNESLKRAAQQITGRQLSPAESDRWQEVADVLVAELKIAAARTTVSSVPAFLAEHLRRRLWKLDKKQARAEGRELPDEATNAAAPGLDAAACPDCGGSGWWYPEGEAKGVAKCKHERLREPSGGQTPTPGAT